MSKKRKIREVVETKQREITTDLVNVLNDYLNKLTGGYYNKQIVIKTYSELVEKNYLVKREYEKLYKSIKYDNTNNYAILRIPVNRGFIINHEFYERLFQLRTSINANYARLLIVSDYNNFAKSLSSVECKEVEKYINCEIVDKIADKIVKTETTEYVNIQIYVKLNKHIVVEITKFIRKKIPT